MIQLVAGAAEVGLSFRAGADDDIESPDHFFDALVIADLEVAAVSFFHDDHHISAVGKTVLTGQEAPFDRRAGGGAGGEIVGRMDMAGGYFLMTIGAGGGAGELLPVDLWDIGGWTYGALTGFGFRGGGFFIYAGGGKKDAQEEDEKDQYGAPMSCHSFYTVLLNQNRVIKTLRVAR